jgi:hypothetical protein
LFGSSVATFNQATRASAAATGPLFCVNMSLAQRRSEGGRVVGRDQPAHGFVDKLWNSRHRSGHHRSSRCKRLHENQRHAILIAVGRGSAGKHQQVAAAEDLSDARGGQETQDLDTGHG